MATLCKNCGHPVKYDPQIQRVTCDHCGSVFVAQDLRDDSQEILEDIKPSRVNDANFMDSYVYTCNSCGGEIFVSGTEASTTCIYCGSPSVVFSRIARHRRPEYIIPFRITKEEVISSVETKFKKSITIPKELRHLKVEDIRGIYLPYWLVNADHYGSVGFSRVIYINNQAEWEGHNNAGSMQVKNLSVNATSILPDEFCSRLEPYTVGAMKLFDESYLLGFYSDASDITFGELQDTVNKRASDMFKAYSVPSGYTLESSEHSTAIHYKELRYAMFPVWFMTYSFEGVNHTIIVNGENGKIASGIPLNDKPVKVLLVLLTLIFSALFFYIFRTLILEMANVGGNGRAAIGFGAMIVAGLVFLIGFSSRRYKKVLKNIKLSQNAAVYGFMKKRQG